MRADLVVFTAHNRVVLEPARSVFISRVRPFVQDTFGMKSAPLLGNWNKNIKPNGLCKSLQYFGISRRPPTTE